MGKIAGAATDVKPFDFMHLGGFRPTEAWEYLLITLAHGPGDSSFGVNLF